MKQQEWMLPMEAASGEGCGTGNEAPREETPQEMFELARKRNRR